MNHPARDEEIHGNAPSIVRPEAGELATGELALRRRVVKLGGSLFTARDWPARFAQWWIRQSPAVGVVVAGGGPWVDAVRLWDRDLRLGDRFCHLLCADLLSLTAPLVAQALRNSAGMGLEVRLADTLASVGAAGASVENASAEKIVWILDAGRLLKGDAESPAPVFAQDWTVTSDTLAAEVAFRWAADELVLLKSRRPPNGPNGGSSIDWNEAAMKGLVDAQFPRFAARIGAVRWVNLREE